jgi:hypothetical protein
MALIADEAGCAEQLAKFFPKLAAIRMPVKVSPTRAGQSRLQESTVLEFGAGEIAIFLSNLPIEFDDRVRVSQQDGKRSVEAAVIALQYHEGRKAVAVRFLNGACDWMRQP